MNGIGVGDFGRADNCWNIQITQRQLWRPDADGLVGEAHWQRVAVGFAVDGDGFDSQLFAGADYPEGNFTAVGYEDFLEHESALAQARARTPVPPQSHLFPTNRVYATMSFVGYGRPRPYKRYFLGRIANSSWLYSIGWPFFVKHFIISPATSASISFISFIASTMQSTWPTSTESPGLTKGGDPGDGDS